MPGKGRGRGRKPPKKVKRTGASILLQLSNSVLGVTLRGNKDKLTLLSGMATLSRLTTCRRGFM
jgi:hypothetical protein